MPIAAHRVLRTTVRSLIAAMLLLAFGRAGQSEAQAIIKVNDNVNFKLGFLIQPQADFQEVANATNNGSGGYQQNLLVRRVRLILGGQVAKNLFFFAETENGNLGKSTQAVGATTGVKAPGTGFNLLDAAGEWRIAKEFNIQFGLVRSPISREGLRSAPNNFLFDTSAYSSLQSTPLQNNGGRDTGFIFRGYFFCDRLEYRSAVLSGLRQAGVKNSPRFTNRLQWNFFDTEVYNLPSYSGVNFGNKKILALGGAYDTQGDYRYASADLYLDFPIPLGSFESTIQYQYLNGGTFLTALPRQNTFQIEGAVYLKGVKLGPSARYEQQKFTADVDQPKNQGRVAIGLNYYPRANNNFNLKIWWQRVTPNVGFATNQFTFQMQAYYF